MKSNTDQKKLLSPLLKKNATKKRSGVNAPRLSKSRTTEWLQHIEQMRGEW